MDSSGGSRFGGEIAGVSLTNKSLDDSEIAALAAAPRPETSATIAGTDAVMGEACTLAAWIKPAVGEAGRILDKCTVGQPDGFTFDTYPGLSLRWIVGNRNLSMPNWLKSGEWQHVAARVDGSGELVIKFNGSTFTVEDLDPDFRNWGGGFWWQNTRL